MSLSPDQDRLRQLMRLAGDRSTDGRNQLFLQMGDLLAEDAPEPNEQAQVIMADIMGKLIGDVEKDMRRQLAQKIAKSPFAPKELIVMLANDDIEIAKPVLQHSEILRDWDLLEIIRHRTKEHQMAIAVRDRVSEAVSGALVEAGHEDVITSLLQNRNAKISQATLEYLVEQAERVDSFQNPLLSRGDLKPDMARQMYRFVSKALREKIAADFKFSEKELSILMVDDEPPADALHADSFEKTMHLVEAIAQAQPLTVPLLIKTLRDGEVPLFLGMISKMAGLNLPAVKKIILEGEGEVVALTLKAVGLDSQQFNDLYKLVRTTRAGTTDVRIHEMSHVLQYFNQLKRQVAQNVLRTWEREPNFLATAMKTKTPAKPAGGGKLLHQPIN